MQVCQEFLSVRSSSCILLPILKDKTGYTAYSENFRCVAIASVLSKLFDSVLFKHISAQCNIADEQFSFQTAKSTGSFIYILKRTVSCFNENGDYVFTCYIDLKKAFDSVNFWKLFIIMFSANVLKNVVKVLA